jgi:hypoxia up-regulated 1
MMLASLLCAILLFSCQVLAVNAVLGVDLGTEYIKAALVKPGTPLEIVLTKDSRRKETSAVAFKPPQNGPKAGDYPERAYGSDAMAIAARFPGDVYPNLKALLGLPADHVDVLEYAARHPDLQLQADKLRGTVAFKSKGAFAPDEEAWLVEELLAMELQSIRHNAEALAGPSSPVRSVVMTVPPFYTIEEKRAIELAADLAGLRVLSLISDGLAVGLNYATTRTFPNLNDGEKPEHHMIFDMGAGSTKATVLRFQSRTVKDVGKYNKTVQEVQVLGSGWDRTLGGDRLNAIILDDMIEQFVGSPKAKSASVTVDKVKSHGRAIAKLSKEAERLRQVLSANSVAQTSFEGLYDDVDFKYKLSRAEFEAKSEAYISRVSQTFEAALKAADVTAQELDSVILHGGATRTPFVQKELETIVGKADKIRSNVNSDEAAVFGAGFRAAELSPSFRVKEIRVKNIAAYPAGMKWVNPSGKAQHQQLWTATSALGASAKELTFTNLNDFDIEFYQSVPSPQSAEVTLDRETSILTTKNLSASATELQEKYSCEPQDIHLKISARLASENGEVEVVKASVECEGEVLEKEGFVDGVKNLFGFGKKDQQPLKDGEEDSASSSESSAPDAESSTTAFSASSASSVTSSSASAAPSDPATDTPKVPTRKTVVVPVGFELKKSGIPQLTKAAIADLKARLKEFEASDKERRLREETLNQLEGFTYKVRDFLDNEKFMACATAAEKAALEKKNKAASEWLYGEGADAAQKALKAKLKGLQDAVDPIKSRMEEADKRPELIKELQNALKESREFMKTQRKQIEEYDAFHASVSGKSTTSSSIASESPSPAAEEESSATQTTDSLGVTPAPTPESDFAGLEDEEPFEPEVPERLQQKGGLKMEDVLKERGPVPPMYASEDLKEVEDLEVVISAWLEEKLAAQEKLGATDDPVLRIRDLTERREKLSKAGLDLAMKGVANFNKRTQSESADGSKTKSSKTKKPKSSKTKKGGPPGAQTIELKPKADGTFDDDEIAEMLRQYGVEKEYNEARGKGGKGETGEGAEGAKFGEAKTGFTADGVKHEEL